MATNAVIGALRVNLGADTAAFDKGLKSAEKSLASFAANITKIGSTIGVGLAAAAAGVAVALHKAFEEADKLGKLSQSIGIPVEQLSALSLAAKLADVSIEELGKGIGKLSRSMSEIAGGKTTGAAAAGFKALGITVTDANGKLKSSNLVLEEVADKFEKMQDGAGKTALAIALFGRSGANLIPLLNAGAKGLKEAREEAEQFGLIVDTRAAKSAEFFNDNLTRLNRVMGGVALKVAAELSPSLGLLTMKILDYIKENEVATTSAQKIITVFTEIGVVVSTVTHFFTQLGKELMALGGVFTAKTWAEMKAAIKAFREEEERSVQGTIDIRKTFTDFNEQARMMADHFGNISTQASQTAAPILAGKNALDDFIKSQQKTLAANQAEAMAVGLSAGARERLKVVMQAETVARENNLKMTDEQRIKVTELANAMQLAALKQEGMNILLETAEPHEKFRLEMEKNAAALKAVGATNEQVAQAGIATAEKFGATWQQVTASATGGFAAFANEMAKSNSKIATVAKALAIVEATINTYVAFTKALAATPPPLNYIAAAGVLAAGLAKVVAIKSQTIPKMSTGGMLTPRMYPGQDSVLMQARVRPDEQVEVRRPGEGSRNPIPQVLTLQFSDALSREFWAKGIEQINRLTSDGYRLKVA